MVVIASKRLEIQSKISELSEVAALTESIGEEAGFSSDEIDDITISVTEAVNNAIKHGNKENESLKVDISYTVDEDKISVEVKDQGGGFEMEGVKDPRIGENLLRDNGRGILIMKTLMDEVNVTSGEDGTVVQLIKFIETEN